MIDIPPFLPTLGVDAAVATGDDDGNTNDDGDNSVDRFGDGGKDTDRRPLLLPTDDGGNCNGVGASPLVPPDDEVGNADDDVDAKEVLWPCACGDIIGELVVDDARLILVLVRMVAS
jgi:hypothetical protein